MLFPGELSNLVMIVGVATMAIGVLGAISQHDMKRILSFHIISQIGYMVFGLGIGGAAAIAATIFYLIHHIPVKTSLFLVEGIIERNTGSSSLDDVSGLARKSPFLAVLFLIPAMSLAGFPPLSGFLAKFAIVRGGLDAEQYIGVGVAIVVSLLTLVSMVKIWVGAFWGEVAPVSLNNSNGVLSQHRSMAAATAILVCLTLVVAVAAGPIYEFATRATDQLLDVERYITAVRSA
jgi:multicomponent Na+:H+ antiporter subunit D